MRKIVLAIATGLGSGYAPIAPGTAGSALAVGLWWLLARLAPGGEALAVPVAALACAGLGVWAAGRAEVLFERHDDGRITIDEVSGQLIALLALPLRPDVALVGFLLFRLFDIWKPPPARQAERLPGGWGVMADDWVAGLYALAVGQLLWRGLFPEGW